MPIIYDQLNVVYAGGRKGRPFEIRFCPRAVEKPWSIKTRKTNGYYFQTLRETLAFAAGRGYIEQQQIDKYQIEIMDALARKWDEE